MSKDAWNVLGRGGRAALVINECQRGLLEAAHAVIPALCAQAAERAIVPRIANLAKGFRQAGLPVIFVHVIHRPDFAGVSLNNPAVRAIARQQGLCEGSPQVEAMPELLPQEVDHVVRRYSGMTMFYGNHLDSLLRNLRIDTVVAAGVSTNVAIPGLVLGALDRGFDVVVAEDCIAGTSAAAHEAILQYQLRPLSHVFSQEEILAALA